MFTIAQIPTNPESLSELCLDVLKGKILPFLRAQEFGLSDDQQQLGQNLREELKRRTLFEEANQDPYRKFRK
jgi:hypothetical protein